MCERRVLGVAGLKKTDEALTVARLGRTQGRLQFQNLPSSTLEIQVRKLARKDEYLPSEQARCEVFSSRLAGAPFRAAGERPAPAAEGRADRPVDLRGEGNEGLGQDRLCDVNV